ncbi:MULTISPECIES: Mth938-like domain-containing protein [unclassified Roseitalea]|uniref:Mth938-like domain-containing protein n=1 Tax=unclassified Roseitalea TaxID=2639107 RepID=UPI00273F91B5|nr:MULTISPECIES: Mth938-like domain-containing protein [unclassified Roseitalea]
MRAGIEIRDAHYPGRAPIDAYGNGGFRFADMSHRGSVIVLPSGIHGWDVARFEDIDEASLAPVFDQSGGIELLLVGCGEDLRVLPRPLREALNGHGVAVESMATGAAVRTFNVLLAEDRQVAAALIAVEDAR